MKFHGAEATVKIGREVEKIREGKNYRHPELDERIRTDRNKQETRILGKARKNGVKVPEVLETAETSFRMQKIDGKMLKEVLDEKPELMEKLAEQVARLHDSNIIHGDLTTSNAIYSEEVYLIDFGLSFHSERTEDKAVDLHLLKNVVTASHKNSEDLWKLFSEKYRELGDEKILEKLPEIEKRARYK